MNQKTRNTTSINKNEIQEEITSAMQANKQQLQMLLRDREQIQEPARFKNFILKVTMAEEDNFLKLIELLTFCY